MAHDWRASGRFSIFRRTGETNHVGREGFEGWGDRRARGEEAGGTGGPRRDEALAPGPGPPRRDSEVRVRRGGRPPRPGTGPAPRGGGGPRLARVRRPARGRGRESGRLPRR